MAFTKDNSLTMERRDFAKLGAAAVGGLGIFSLAGCQTESVKYADVVANTGIDDTVHWAMAIDVEKLNELNVMKDMSKACHTYHNVPSIPNTKQEVKWIWGETFEHLFEDLQNDFVEEAAEDTVFPALCNHCENPPCCRACPTEATFQRPDGIVMMDYHRCIACRFCMTACAYGARSLNFIDPRPYIQELNQDYPTRSKGVVEKCMFCYEQIDKGKKPLCVEASKGAVAFGDLNDPDSDVRKALKGAHSIRRKVHLGTEPSVYYIVKAGE